MENFIKKGKQMIIKKMVWVGLFCCATTVYAEVSFSLSATTGDSDFDLSLNSINVEARQSLPGFYSSMQVEFNAPRPQIEQYISVHHLSPADVYMTFQIASLTHRSPDNVVVEFTKHKGKGGWGELAKQMGIKPGSAEFHALKNKAGSHKKSHGSKGERTTVTVETPGTKVKVTSDSPGKSEKSHGKKK